MANSGRPSNEDAPRVPGEERSGLPWGRIVAALVVLALLALLILFACQALRGSGGGNTEQEQDSGQEQGAAGETTNGGRGGAVEGGGTTAPDGGGTAGEIAQGNRISAEVAGGQASGDGTTVTVPSAGISGASGWLAIHADEGGEPGDVLGYAPLREGESVEDVAIPLDEPVGSGTLYAVVHVDDPADGGFTFPDGDPPVEANGSAAAEPLRYTVSTEQAGEPLPSSGGPDLLLLAGSAAALLATLVAIFSMRRQR